MITEQIRDQEISGRNLVIEDVIVKYVLKTLERDLEILEESGADAFRIEGLEKELKASVGEFRFKGYIDRLDSITGDRIRVVDYKTGKVKPEDLELSGIEGEKAAAAVFGDGPFRSKPKIAFQLFIYDMLLRENGLDRGRTICDSVYSTAKLFTEPPVTVDLGESFYGLMKEGLEKLLSEMEDLSVPFRRTEDADVCAYCDFRIICGR